MSTLRNSHELPDALRLDGGEEETQRLNPVVEENPTAHLFGELGLLMHELGFLFLLGIGKGEITESLNLNVT